MSIHEQVLAFHQVGELPVLDSPQVPPEDRVRLRARLVTEEFFELLVALSPERALTFKALEKQVLELVAHEPLNVDLVEVADACADIDYLVEGLRLEFGIDGGPVADEVHRSNMAKYGPGSWKREDGKIMKPPGWTPPDIAGVLERQKKQ